MLHKNKNAGFSLIELLIVMSIIATLSLLTLISFRDSRVEVVLDATVEILEDNFSSLRALVLFEKYELVEVDFDLQNPKLYMQRVRWEYTGNLEDSFAKNVRFDSVEEASVSSEGNISFSWSGPVDGSNVEAYVYGDGKKIGTYPANGVTITSPWTYLDVSEYQNYDFEFVFPNKKKALYVLSLNYFSKETENISADGGSLIAIEKIEVQDFGDNWITVNNGTMKILAPFGRVKFFSDSTEYKDIRLTLSRQGKSLVYNLK